LPLVPVTDRASLHRLLGEMRAVGLRAGNGKEQRTLACLAAIECKTRDLDFGGRTGIVFGKKSGEFHGAGFSIFRSPLRKPGLAAVNARI
jgi:hypothetical protein